jgi:hypothetical protein
MPDNVRVTSPSAGTIIATDDIGGVHIQRVKPVLGPDGSAVDLAFGQAAMAASVPVVIASDQAAVPVSASSLPLPANAATEATLASIAADVDRLPVLVSGRMPVDGSVAVSNFPATQAVIGMVEVSNLPATQQVSAAALPLPAGAATETTLAAINTKSPSLGQAAMAASSPVVIAADQSAVPVSLPSIAVNSYSFTGAISINTDLLVIPCSGVEAVSIQCISMGTGGVVTPAWSNDGTTYIAASIMTPAGVANATFNVAGLWTTPVLARFLRLRLTTATSGLTTALSVQPLTQANTLPTVSQPVVVAGTVPVSGSLTSAGTTVNTPVQPTTTITNSAGTRRKSTGRIRLSRLTLSPAMP